MHEGKNEYIQSCILYIVVVDDDDYNGAAADDDIPGCPDTIPLRLNGLIELLCNSFLLRTNLSIQQNMFPSHLKRAAVISFIKKWIIYTK